jgi:septal ring factor EnvC (AmiA/AmiB activator)
MPLDIKTLEDAIFKALDDSSNINVKTDSSSDNLKKSKNAREETAKELAKAINLFVKSGTVNTTVTTTGSAAAQTGTGVGSIS